MCFEGLTVEPVNRFEFDTSVNHLFFFSNGLLKMLGVYSTVSQKIPLIPYFLNYANVKFWLIDPFNKKKL